MTILRPASRGLALQRPNPRLTSLGMFIGRTSGQPGQAAQALHLLAIGTVHFDRGQTHEDGLAARVAGRQAITGTDQLPQANG